MVLPLVKDWRRRRPEARIVRTTSPEVQAAIREMEVRAFAETGWKAQRGEKVPLWEAMRDGEWRGNRCFIIGGGPSLRGFDFERLRGEKIIAVNRAFMDVPWADMMISMDNRFYRWILRDDIKGARSSYVAFKGLRVWVDMSNLRYGADVHYVKGWDGWKMPHSLKGGIYVGGNSGFCALQIAVLLDASPIYLLGFDMRIGKDTHYHSGYPIKTRQASLDRYKATFGEFAKMIKQRNIDVTIINLNKDSALRCFEFGDVGQVLSDD
jgi:hypothetical protein